MIENNVTIEHRIGGALVDTRQQHNTWTYYGKDYLSRVVALQSIGGGGDVPQHNARVRYLGLGIGSVMAVDAAFAPPLVTTYPPGFDPHATAGNTYSRLMPENPVISTLERPVRRAGGSNPYSSALPTDTWLFDDIETVYRDTQSVTFRFIVDCTLGDVVYGPYTYVPISEAALFLSTANENTPYSSAVAYVDFATVFLQSDSVVTLSWTVRFAS